MLKKIKRFVARRKATSTRDHSANRRTADGIVSNATPLVGPGISELHSDPIFLDFDCRSYAPSATRDVSSPAACEGISPSPQPDVPTRAQEDVSPSEPYHLLSKHRRQLRLSTIVQDRLSHLGGSSSNSITNSGGYPLDGTFRSSGTAGSRQTSMRFPSPSSALIRGERPNDFICITSPTRTLGSDSFLSPLDSTVVSVSDSAAGLLTPPRARSTCGAMSPVGSASPAVRSGTNTPLRRLLPPPSASMMPMGTSISYLQWQSRTFFVGGVPPAPAPGAANQQPAQQQRASHQQQQSAKSSSQASTRGGYESQASGSRGTHQIPQHHHPSKPTASPPATANAAPTPFQALTPDTAAVTSDIVIDGELLGDDEVLATAGTDIQGDGGAGAIGAMDDYESLLEDAVMNDMSVEELQAQMRGTAPAVDVGLSAALEEEASSLDASTSSASATSTTRHPSFAQFQQVALSLLPESGQAVPLTAIAPGFDTEAMSEKYGSVLEFLNMCGSKITVEREKATGRFMVRRKLSAASAALNAVHQHQTAMAAAQSAAALDEMHNQQQQAAAKNKRRLTLQRINLSPAAHAEDKDAITRLLQSFVQSAFLDTHEEANTSTPTPAVMTVLRASQHLDDEARAEVKQRFGTFTKMLKLHGSDLVDLSWDGLRVGYPKGSMKPRDLHMPPDVARRRFIQHQKQQLAGKDEGQSPAAAEDEYGYSADSWAVELDLDDVTPMSMAEADAADKAFFDSQGGDDTASTIGFDTLQIKTSEKRLAAEAQTPLSVKEMMISRRDLTNVPSAPAPPRINMAATVLKNAAGSLFDKNLTPEQSKKLLDSHTALAKDKGWKTPAQMLDLFIPCVPTYWVSISHLTLSAELQSAIGSNTVYKVFKAYLYYFEVKDENGTVMVKLRDTVEHPQKGVEADPLYLHIKGKKTRAITNTVAAAAFPTMDSLAIAGRGGLAAYVQLKKKEFEAAKEAAQKGLVKPAAPPARQALLHVIPYDRFVFINEEIVAAVKVEAYRLKTAAKARKIKMATAIDTKSAVNSSGPKLLIEGGRTDADAALPANQQAQMLSTPLAEGTTSARVAQDPLIEAIDINSLLQEIHSATSPSRNDYLTYPPRMEDKDIAAMSLASGSWEPEADIAKYRASLLVRLRPFWCAPEAAADFSVDSSPYQQSSVAAPTAPGQATSAAGSAPPLSSLPAAPALGQPHFLGLIRTDAEVKEEAAREAAAAAAKKKASHNHAAHQQPAIVQGQQQQQPWTSSGGMLATALHTHRTLTSRFGNLTHQMGLLVRSAGLWNDEAQVISKLASATAPAHQQLHGTSSSNTTGGASAAKHTLSLSGALEVLFADNAKLINDLPESREDLANLVLPMQPASLLSFYQLHGGSFWVDLGKRRVRKYAAFVDLDDIQHVLVDALREAMTMLQIEHKRQGGGEYTLDELRSALPPNLRGMLEPSKATITRATTAAHASIAGDVPGMMHQQQLTSNNNSHSGKDNNSPIAGPTTTDMLVKEVVNDVRIVPVRVGVPTLQETPKKKPEQEIPPPPDRQFPPPPPTAADEKSTVTYCVPYSMPLPVGFEDKELHKIPASSHQTISQADSKSSVPIVTHVPQHRILKFLKDHKKYFDVRIDVKRIPGKSGKEEDFIVEETVFVGRADIFNRQATAATPSSTITTSTFDLLSKAKEIKNETDEKKSMMKGKLMAAETARDKAAVELQRLSVASSIASSAERGPSTSSVVGAASISPAAANKGWNVKAASSSSWSSMLKKK